MIQCCRNHMAHTKQLGCYCICVYRFGAESQGLQPAEALPPASQIASMMATRGDSFSSQASVGSAVSAAPRVTADEGSCCVVRRVHFLKRSVILARTPQCCKTWSVNVQASGPVLGQHRPAPAFQEPAHVLSSYAITTKRTTSCKTTHLQNHKRKLNAHPQTSCLVQYRVVHWTGCQQTAEVALPCRRG